MPKRCRHRGSSDAVPHLGFYCGQVARQLGMGLHSTSGIVTPPTPRVRAHARCRRGSVIALLDTSDASRLKQGLTDFSADTRRTASPLLPDVVLGRTGDWVLSTANDMRAKGQRRLEITPPASPPAPSE